MATETDVEIGVLEAEVQELQRALAFWLPSMPVQCKEPLYTRLAHDIDLLVGYLGPRERDAEELGWVALNEPPPERSTQCRSCGLNHGACMC